jgi:hypothetical protein
MGIVRRAASAGTIAAIGAAAPVLASQTAGCLGAGSDPASAEAGPADATLAEADAARMPVEGGDARDVADAGTGSPPMGGLRVGNLSSDAPSVDLCVALHGTGKYQGPLLGVASRSAVDAGAADAGTAGVSFGQVSTYLPVAPGAYDAIVVVGGASDCFASIAGDPTPLPALKAGRFETVLLLGDANMLGGGPALRLYATTDDGDALSPVVDGAALSLYVRFLHAAPSAPPVDVILGGQTLFADVPFGQIGSEAGAGVSIDKNGYAVEGALNTTVSVRPSGASAGVDGGNVLANARIVSATGVALTLALVDVSSDGGGSQSLLACTDNAQTSRSVSSCAEVR